MAEQTTEKLPAKTVQIQMQNHPGDFNCGPHMMLVALCADGSMWIRYFSSGGSNVPTEGLWHLLEPASLDAP